MNDTGAKGSTFMPPKKPTAGPSLFVPGERPSVVSVAGPKTPHNPAIVLPSTGSTSQQGRGQIPAYPSTGPKPPSNSPILLPSTTGTSQQLHGKLPNSSLPGSKHHRKRKAKASVSENTPTSATDQVARLLTMLTTGNMCPADSNNFHFKPHDLSCATGRLNRYNLNPESAVEPFAFITPNDLMAPAQSMAHMGGAATMHQVQELQRLLGRFLSSVDKNGSAKVSTVRELNEMLKKETSRASVMREVGQQIHDIINNITGTHVNSSVVATITNLLCDSLDTFSDSSSSETYGISASDDERDDYNGYPAGRSNANRPITPRNTEPFPTPRDPEELVLVKRELEKERIDTQAYITSLKDYYTQRENSINQEYQGTIAQLTKQLQDSRFMSTSDNDEVNVLRSQVDNLERTKDELEQSFRETLEQRQELEVKLRSLESTSSSVKLNQTQLQTQLRGEKQQVIELMAKLREEQDTNAEFRKSLEMSLDENNRILSIVESINAQLCVKGASVSEFQKIWGNKLEEIVNNVNCMEIYTSDLSKEMNQEREFRMFLEKELTGQREFVEHCEYSVLDINKKIEHAHEEVRQANEEKEKFRTISEKFKGMWLQMKDRVKSLELLGDSVREHLLRNPNASQPGSAGNYHALSRQLSEYGDTMRTLMLTAHETKILSEKYQKHLSSYKSMVRDLLVERDSLVQRSEAAESDIQKIRTQVHEAEITGCSMKDELDKIRDEVHVVTEQKNKLSAESMRLQNMYNAAKLKIEALESENIRLSRDISTLNPLKTQQDELLMRISVAENESSALKKQLSSIQAVCDERIAQIEAHHAEAAKNLQERWRRSEDTANELLEKVALLRSQLSEKPSANGPTGAFNVGSSVEIERAIVHAIEQSKEDDRSAKMDKVLDTLDHVCQKISGPMEYQVTGNISADAVDIVAHTVRPFATRKTFVIPCKETHGDQSGKKPPHFVLYPPTDSNSSIKRHTRDNE